MQAGVLDVKPGMGSQVAADRLAEKNDIGSVD